MKTFMSFALVAMLFVGIASSFSTTAQFESTQNKKGTTGFDYFRVHRQGSGVSLNWSAPGAETFQIERSYDGEFFDLIASVEAGAVSKLKYLDQSVFPGVIYYRVAAVMADGSVEYSEVESVRIVKKG